MKRILFKRLSFILISVCLAGFSIAQTATGTQTFTASGTEASPLEITINIPEDITVNDGKPIISITISKLTSDFEMMGLPVGDLVGCGDLFSYNLNLDGQNVVMTGCADAIEGQNLTDASVVTLKSVDMGASPIPGLLTYNLGAELKINVTYAECDANAGNNGTITACKNEPIDLEAVLEGSPQAGGTWYDAEGNAVTSPNITTPNIPGQYYYTYKVVLDESCEDEATLIIDVQDCDYLSVEKQSFDNVNLFPNPTSGKITISGLPLSTTNQIDVIDITGKVVQSIQTSKTSFQFDVSQLQKGVYFVKLIGTSSEKVMKFIRK